MSHCTICKHHSSKTVLYVCQSGHIMCENCHPKGLKHDKEGNLKCENKNNSKPKKNKNIKTYEDVVEIEDLACGDFIKKLKRGKVLDPNIYLNQEVSTKTHNNITIKDKNPPDYGNFSNTDSIINVSHEQCRTDKDNNERFLVQRPITCPVCLKILATNSILVHFYFDHSKVPKFTLEYSTTLHTAIKITDLGLKSSCVAVLNLVHKKSSSRFPEVEIDKTGNNANTLIKDQCLHAKYPLLLMAACLASNGSDGRNIIQESATVKNELFTKEVDLILWVCKTTDDGIIYNLSLSKEDRKFSYSFTGEAVHVRESQVAESVYYKSECVIVRGNAANKMINNFGHIQIYITVLL